MKPLYDVVVAGGGISGTMAAAGALRAGASVLIIEQYGFLGGMLTAAGVGPMMTFHAGDTQVIRGTTGELIDRLVAKNLSPGHVVDTTAFTYTVTPFDLEGMKRELEAMVLEQGGDILYHTMLAGVQMSGPDVTSLTVCNKAGLSEVRGRVFVDATGDGDVSAWAGVPFTKGRESDGASQPMTMKMRMVGVNTARVRAFIEAHPEEFPRLEGHRDLVRQGARLSIGGFVETLARARAAGEVTIPREDILFFEGNTPGEFIINTSRVLGMDATDPFSLSRAETEGRRQSLELEHFLRKYIPGFENAMLVFTGPRIGVRGSRQILGEYTLTARDLLERRAFPDVIAHSGYPIDIHNPTGAGTEHHSLNWGEYYGVPYRTLVNRQTDNLLTVGRCLSATFEAQAAVRLTPTLGAIGQAGGVAAAMAAALQCPAREVPVPELQAELRRQGAFLDIPE